MILSTPTPQSHARCVHLDSSYYCTCGLNNTWAIKMDNPSNRSSTLDTVKSRKRFVSYRLRGEYEKPWLQDPKFKRTKVNNYIIYGFMALGVVIAGVVAFFQIRGSLPTEVRPIFTLSVFFWGEGGVSRSS